MPDSDSPEHECVLIYGLTRAGNGSGEYTEVVLAGVKSILGGDRSFT